MKYESFGETKETRNEQQELDDKKNSEFDEKIKNRSQMSVNEKQDLLKEVKERNFSRGLPEGTKEKFEIETEIEKKESSSELQPEKKIETNSIKDASENLDKELDDQAIGAEKILEDGAPEKESANGVESKDTSKKLSKLGEMIGSEGIDLTLRENPKLQEISVKIRDNEILREMYSNVVSEEYAKKVGDMGASTPLSDLGRLFHNYPTVEEFSKKRQAYKEGNLRNQPEYAKREIEKREQDARIKWQEKFGEDYDVSYEKFKAVIYGIDKDGKESLNQSEKNEKQDLPKEVNEQNFSHGLPEGEIKEEAEINSNKRAAEELRPEKKVEAGGMNYTSEDLDKELDDELNKYDQQQKAERDKALKEILNDRDYVLFEKFKNMMDQHENSRENVAGQEKQTRPVETDGDTIKKKKQLHADIIAERRDAWEQVKKLGEDSGMDVSDALSDIEKEIEELKKKNV